MTKIIDNYYVFELPMYTYFNSAFGDRAPKIKYKKQYFSGEQYYKYGTKGNSVALVPKESWLNPGRVFLGKLLNNNKEFPNFLYKIFSSIIKLSAELEQINYQDLKQKRARTSVADFYKKYINVFPWVIGFGYSLDMAIEEYAQTHKLKRIKSFGESFVAAEERDLARIFKVKNLVKQKQLLADHALKYSYILNNYAGSHPADIKYFTTRKNEVLRKKFIKSSTRLSKPRNVGEWIAFSTYIRDQRKKCNLLYISLMDRYLKQECRRLGLLYKQAVMLTPEEFEVQKNIKLKDYKGVRFIHYTHAGLMDISKKEWLSLLGKENYSVAVLSGVTASKGKVVGKVKIVFGPKDFKKIKPGDVLVTSMTRPEFAPILKKVSAIITNEGGITCHAAIISREMKLPCIIATSKATKVFKDGDVVEVDANKGIVKKISNS